MYHKIIKVVKKIMGQKQVKKIQTDIDVKRKAIKQVVLHIKKKITADYVGVEHMKDWLCQVDDLLLKDDFNIKDYI
jgi:hypothetical protein